VNCVEDTSRKWAGHRPTNCLPGLYAGDENHGIDATGLLISLWFIEAKVMSRT